jgi:predicted Fe-Mo cluster-binding NifX family protein
MNICIPVVLNEGLESSVNEHFGSSPAFLIVDTETGQHRAIENRDQNHTHGMCQPLAALSGERIDAIVVGGIGMGALNKLAAAGIDVFLAQPGTAAATVDAFKAGTLRRATPQNACVHHGGCHGAHS